MPTCASRPEPTGPTDRDRPLHCLRCEASLAGSDRHPVCEVCSEELLAEHARATPERAPGEGPGFPGW